MSSLVKHEQRFKQPVLFDGLFGKEVKTTGSDIDWIWESTKEGVFVVAEVKAYGKPLSVGQDILLRRMVDSAIDSGLYKKGVALLLWHKIEDANEPVLIRDCMIASTYKVVEGKDCALNWLDVEMNKHIFGRVIDKIIKV